ITGSTPVEERQEIFRKYQEKEIQVLSNCMVLCLDDETEILTSSGWVGSEEMTEDHLVANWDVDGSVFFAKPREVVRRPRRKDEPMVTCDTKTKFRVTGTHRMIHRSPGGKWIKSPAKDLVGIRTLLPVSGQARPFDMDVPASKKVSSSHSRRVARNAYHLRVREGFGRDESLKEARRRIDARESLSYTEPKNLSFDDCRFIGFWLGDGSKNDRLIRGGGEYTASQSKVYPKIIEWFDSVVNSIGLDSIKRDREGHFTWSFPRGTGFGSQSRSGLYRLEPYLDKGGTKLLWGLNEAQFDAFLEGLWYADVNHGKAENGYSYSGVIYSTRKGHLDLIQSVASVRGYKTSLGKTEGRKPNHNDLYALGFRKSTERGVVPGSASLEEDYRDEMVWSVKTETKNIITRYKGVVTVMGNTEGWDMPQAEVAVIARPTQSRGLFIQMAGRVLRPFPGKEKAL